MRRSRSPRVLASLVLVSAFAGRVQAQEDCVEYRGDFWSGNCDVRPGNSFSKAYSMQRFEFNGSPYLAVDMGDEIQFFSLSDPESPTSLGWTSFRMPLPGDAEHIMAQFSVGDDVRFAFATHGTGVTFVDLGTGAQPSPGAVTRHLASAGGLDYLDSTPGGLVFDHNDEDFLLTHVFEDGCGAQAGLFRLDQAGGATTHTLVSCVPYPAGTSGRGIMGGRKVGSYLYVALHEGAGSANSENVTIYELTGSEPNLVEREVDAMFGYPVRRNGFEVDAVDQLVASTDYFGRAVRLYATGFGGEGSWASPVLLSTVSIPDDFSYDPPTGGPRSVALDWPLMFIDDGGLFDITDPANPVRLVHTGDYFSASVVGEQNPTGFACLDRYVNVGVFHPTADELYLPRFPIAQVFDVSACVDPVELGDDAGSGGLDAAVPADASRMDAGVGADAGPEPYGDGCTCRAAGGRSASRDLVGFAALGLLALSVVGRRRR